MNKWHFIERCAAAAHSFQLTPELVFIGMAIAPRTVPSMTWKIGIVLRPFSVLRRGRLSELFPLTARGVEPGGGR